MNSYRIFIVILGCLSFTSGQRPLLAQQTNELEHFIKIESAKFNARFQRAESETAGITAARNRGDKEEVARLIEKSEALWSNDPVYYLDFETQAAVLLEASNPPMVLSIFDNIMRKKSPDDLADSVNYFLQKTVFILRYINTPQIADNQERLLKIANFFGEIRSNIISGYLVIHRGMNDSVNIGWYDFGTNSSLHFANIFLFKSPTQEQWYNSQWINAVSNRLAPHEVAYLRSIYSQPLSVTNKLQMILRQCNDVLLPHLLSDCSRFSPDNPTNADFLKQVITAAHLTEEESRKLKGKNN